jgi:hypothetical protein
VEEKKRGHTVDNDDVEGDGKYFDDGDGDEEAVEEAEDDEEEVEEVVSVRLKMGIFNEEEKVKGGGRERRETREETDEREQLTQPISLTTA